MKALLRIHEMQNEAHTLLRRLDMLALVVRGRNGEDLPYAINAVQESTANLDDHSDELPKDEA
jgi:hypothetical protein